MASHISFYNAAKTAFDETYELINSTENWKEVKRTQLGDVVATKKNTRGDNIYRINSIIDTSAEKLIKALQDVSNSTKWNKTLTKCEVISELDEGVQITYQITSGGGGNLVSPRDFALVIKKGYIGKDYLQAGCSIEHPDAPKNENLVRAWNGPGGQMVRIIPSDPNKCELYWLMDCKYNGWILPSILAIAMPIAQTQFVECVREMVKTL